MIAPAIALLAIFLLYYILFLRNVMRGLKLLIMPSSSSLPFASVIVAARNEERNIRQCIHSLLDQTYKKNNYEIIIVDDHSGDRTREIVAQLAVSTSETSLKILSLKNDASAFGKPAAIARGISEATGEIVLCTDADCVPPRGWIESMVGCFESSVAFVAGPVLEGPSDSYYSRVQQLEFLGLITTAAGLIGSGSPIVCNGANIAYRKSAFQKISGYGNSTSSCDDETLMQRIVKRNIGKVVFNRDPNSMVLTPSAGNFSSFWRQRTRWAAKRGHYEDNRILSRLICLYGFFLALFLGIVAALFEPSLRAPVAAALIVKLLADLAVLKRGAKIFSHRIAPFQFLVAELFHVPYIVIAGLQGQISPMRWKDREL